MSFRTPEERKARRAELITQYEQQHGVVGDRRTELIIQCDAASEPAFAVLCGSLRGGFTHLVGPFETEEEADEHASGNSIVVNLIIVTGHELTEGSVFIIAGGLHAYGVFPPGKSGAFLLSAWFEGGVNGDELPIRPPQPRSLPAPSPELEAFVRKLGEHPQ